MSNIRQLKRRITTAANIAKITKAMEMTAASKMRRAQEQAIASRAYSRAIQSSLKKAAAYTDPSLHPLLARQEVGVDVLVIFSTDRGQCGALNTHLFKTSVHWFSEHPQGKVIAIGKKAVNFVRKLDVEIHAQFTELPDYASVHDILPIASLITEGFLNQSFRSVQIVYMDFINTLSQKVRMVPLLPIAESFPNTDETMIVPTVHSEYIFEPSAKEILSDLLPYYIENSLYQTLLESKASEHSSRMVAMKNASENADDLAEELKLVFNKSRQAAITDELRDIATATLTLTA